jgi:hypothetical protein
LSSSFDYDSSKYEKKSATSNGYHQDANEARNLPAVAMQTGKNASSSTSGLPNQFTAVRD